MTPESIRAAASDLGEDRDRTASAASTSVPSVLAALSDVASTDRGAAHLKEAIEAKAYAGESPDLVGAARDRTLLDDELGRKAWALSDDVARSSGLRRDSAHKLVGGVTALALATLAKSGAPTTVGGLRTMLGGAREREAVREGEVVYDVPTAERERYREREREPYREREREPYRAGTVANDVPAVEQPRARERERYDEERAVKPARRRHGWLWLVALVALALVAYPFVRDRIGTRSAGSDEQTPATETAPPAAKAPAAPVVTPPAAPVTPEQTAAPAAAPGQAAAPAAPGQAAAPAAAQPAPIGELSAFLAGNEGSTPRTFTLPVQYAQGAATPTQDSVPAVKQLASALTDHPAAKIRIESQAGAAGQAAANETLSSQRSDAVKAMLVEEGIDPARIETGGTGQAQPVNTNAPAQAGAESGGTTVIVTVR